MRHLATLSAAALLLACVPALAGDNPAEGTYRIDATAKDGKLEIRFVSLKAGTHLNKDAPFKAVLKSEGAKVAKEKITKADVAFEGENARFEVDYSGAGTVNADLSFVWCSKEWCVTQKKSVAIPVDPKS